MASRPQTPNEFSREEDSIEIEVVPSKPVPVVPRRPRTPNPSVDDVIASGEIVEPRSRIIKSSGSMPTLSLREDATEQVKVVRIPVPTERRSKVLWLIAAILPALAAAATFFVQPAPTAKQDTSRLATAAEMIGTTFDAEARAALVRVEAIATSSMLRAGIETDAKTLADMFRDKDVVFPVEGKQVLEVFQLRDGARTSLLRVPPEAAALAPPTAGKTRIEARGDALVVVANAAVPEQASGISGEVVISVPIDLEQVSNRLAEVAHRAALVGLPRPIVLVEDTGKAGKDITIPIATKLLDGPTVSLAAVIPQPAADKQTGLKVARYACIGLASLLLMVFAVSVVRK